MIKQLGLQDYQSTWQAMQSFTDERDETTPDELWVVEHPPVFTQGLNGKAEHLIALKPEIPLVQTDRGGQVTYHGPGQLIVYCLLDLKRSKLGVKDLVHRLEKAIIGTLTELGIQSEARADAPGVYVQGNKIASLGLKIRRHKSYHGLSLNLDMDLTPFSWINPCGLNNMQMAQVADFIQVDQVRITQRLLDNLKSQLSPEISF